MNNTNAFSDVLGQIGFDGLKSTRKIYYTISLYFNRIGHLRKNQEYLFKMNFKKV